MLDNVRVGRNLSLAEAQRALSQVGAWEAIQKLPEGVNTVLATGGASLSRGCAQALMLARAIAGQPRLLIVDAVLDAVQDAEQREILANTIFDPVSPWTLMLVSSRPELLRRCSRTLRLPDGILQEAV